MRAIFSVVGLLLAVLIVGLLAKKQLSGGPAPVSASGAATQGVAAPTGTPKEQVQQFQRAVQDSMQQPRPMPDEK